MKKQHQTAGDGISRKTPSFEIEPMRIEVVETLIMLVVLQSLLMVASNLAALKIWRLPGLGLPVDAGIIMFPVSYVVGDLLIYVYGHRLADRVPMMVAAGMILTSLGLLAAKVALPDYPGADNSSFLVVQAATERIFLASTVAFLASQLVNNAAFMAFYRRMMGNRRLTEKRRFKIAEIGSSLVARLVDVLLFEFLAFFGMLSLEEFWAQTIFAYAAGAALELTMSGMATRIALKVVNRLQYRNGQNLDSSEQPKAS